VARLIYGTLAAPVFLPEYLKGQLHILGRDFPTYRVFLILFSSILIFLLWFGVERTRWGAMVRAAVDNRGMAQSVGINTKMLFTLTFALGSGLAGLGGALGADILPVQWSYPFEHLVYFLIVVAVGGLGSLRGPFIAALVIGVADTACKYWIPEFGAFLIYAATIALLLWRPMGLVGMRAG
jgi:branched-chain amino acid transport system permease protein